MRTFWGSLVVCLLLPVGSAAQEPNQSFRTGHLASDDSIPFQTDELQGTTSLYFPDYVQGQGWSVQLVLGNVDSTAEATGEVVVYDQDGRKISDLFDTGPRFGIPSQGSRVLRSTGTGAIRRGWIEVRSESGSVWGLLTYRNAETGIEVGVASVKLGDHFALFVEETSEIGTGLAIFKPELAPEIELQVRDEGGNDPIGEVLTLGNFQQQALTLPEWFRGVDTTFLREFRGLLFLRAPDADLFAPLGLRFGKEKGSLSAVPVIPIRYEAEGSSPNPLPPGTPQSENLLFFPDYVEGGGWSVQLVLVNVGATAAGVGVAAYDQDGHPVRELFESGSTFELAAHGSRVLRTPERSAIRRGWIEVETGTASVGGLLTYRHAETGIEVGVAPVELGDHFALFVEETSQIGTGLAIFKPDASPEIELRIRDDGGNDPIGQVLTFRNFQQRARTLPEWFQGLDTTFLRDFRGLLFLRAPHEDPFAPLGLRFGKEKGSLSAVPVMPILPLDGDDATPAADRAALTALYNATGGPNWTRNDNWLSDRPLEEWFGVRVDGQGRVIRLSLGENNLAGSMPPQLGNLDHLTVLDLGRNGLTGPIPGELASLTNLTRLWLGGNDLAGSIPAQLGNLTNLTILSLASNDLTGPIPPLLGNLVNLELLYLYDNGLTGPIPAELGSLANLRVFLLNDQDLTGSIPPQLGNLASLEVLVLDGNDLTGPIPVELCSLTNLEVLAFSDNGLTGRLPMCLARLPYKSVALCEYKFVRSGRGVVSDLAEQHSGSCRHGRAMRPAVGSGNPGGALRHDRRSELDPTDELAERSTARRVAGGRRRRPGTRHRAVPSQQRPEGGDRAGVGRALQSYGPGPLRKRPDGIDSPATGQPRESGGPGAQRQRPGGPDSGGVVLAHESGGPGPL